MATEVMFGITDGSWIYADGARHFLWYDGTDFDVYYSSNARETIYIILEHPKDRDLLVKFTSVDYKSMENYELTTYIKKQLPEILEKFNA